MGCNTQGNALIALNTLILMIAIDEKVPLNRPAGRMYLS